MPPGSEVGSFLRSGVRVPEPSSDSAEDLDVRWARVLVVPQAVVAGTVSVVAGEGAGACSWDELRATYEEQAAPGVPEAACGLELMNDGRWPSDGSPRRQ